MRKGFFENRKKGVSVMVSYVLLVVFAIIISGIVYQWLKTYVPKQALECPEGVSVFIKEASFDPDNSQLIITLKNNGRFNLAGYFIHGKNSSEQKLPTIDLSGYLNETQGGMIFGNSVLFEEANNSFSPDSEESYFFDIPSSVRQLYSIRIIPTRFQEIEGKSRFASCSNALTEQIVGEPEIECISEDISVTCEGRVCGEVNNNCGDPVTCPPNDCPIGQYCSISGTCDTPLPSCGDGIINSGEQCDNGAQNGVACTPAYGSSCIYCSALCETITLQGPYCGDGILTSPPEQCDDGDTDNLDGCSSTCLVEGGWTCTGQPSTCWICDFDNICDESESCSCSDCEEKKNGCVVGQYCSGGVCVSGIPNSVTDCSDYCVYLGIYSGGTCRQNEAQCLKYNQVSIGNMYPEYCTTSLTPFCCCTPI